MKMQYLLYNPHANNGHGEEQAYALKETLDSESVLCDMTKIDSYTDFFADLSGDEKIIICGGAGTINRFINDTADINFSNSIYYAPAGSGNDFANDVGKRSSDVPFCIDEYLKDLPSVQVNGVDKYFINGVGY